MSLFQESIIRKHLGYLDQEVVDKAYLRFKEVYSANKIINIKVAKEEQYQEGFIKDIFGAVLGYSVFPEQPFNIQTEKKNESDSKKADGAIFQGENVVGVIELKDNKTKNLDAVKDQAFGYKNNHKDCSYVISSNFHKLRFYLDDATDYEEFDLYNLDKETFKRFYLYLHKEGLLDKNIPRLLRQETKFHEENITKSLYKDYSSFKNSFFQNVVKNNPQHDKLLLFVKSQKFLDKVLFVLFAEDKGLVATNSIVQIVEKWQNLKNDAFDTPKPLYELVALFFNNLFIGKKDQKGGVLIPEFGGEIFAPDEVLDTLLVDDDVLKDDLLKLSKYDFNTDVDVNILGHIFEHSLSEIEEVEAELKGEVADKTKGKRKKDGVFYTPKYITKYIVENTIGKLCNEKKAELKLDIDIAIFEFQKTDGKLNAKGIELYTTLNKYKDWLLTLKILDPACGSGAFLNQAVNFLIQEHKFVDDIIAELTNSPLRLFDTDIAILENNIYGVDINEESIEIAKLSLWLRTAKQGRKLSNLSNNIKCGNSLIDDPVVAGDKAFNWQNEFPEVFAKGGFDVVIGNPPYVRQELFKEIKPFLELNYKCYNSVADLYTYFIEKGINLINQKGLFSFILPNKFLKATYGKEIRKVIKDESNIQLIYDFDDYPVFEDATTYPLIFIISKTYKTKEIKFSTINKKTVESPLDQLIKNEITVSNEMLKESGEWNFMNNKLENIFSKIRNNSVELSKYVNKQVYLGIKTGKNEAFIIDKETKEEIINNNKIEEKIILPIATGKEIYRYKYLNNEKYLLFTQYDIDIKNEYPSTFEWLKNFEEDLQKRGDKGKDWWNLRTCDYYDKIVLPKIIWRSISNECGFYLDSDGRLLLSNNNYFIASNSFTLLGILNSRLTFLFLSNVCTTLQGGFFDFRRDKVLQIPISQKTDLNDLGIGKTAELQQINNTLFQDLTQKFQRTLERKFALTELPKKLQDWYLLSYAEFIKELAKKKIKLSLNEEAEWETYFTTEAKKVLELKAQIAKTDKEIDQMVYALYELTEDEIKIVEGS
jgi:hypothetical protein